jgi:thermolabile hemolysin
MKFGQIARSSVFRLRIAIVYAVVSATASGALAGPFSSLVIFGDSLSDIGNISQASFGIYPGPYYYQRRFSNGPVYTESLYSGLGFGTLAASTSGGDDFAYGGAQTSGTSGLDGIFIKDVDEQVSQFLSTRTTDSQALYEIFTGANDFINGQTNVNVPVTTIIAQINRLVAKGARQFFVPNLPLLGETPRFNGNSATKSQYDVLTEQFNTSLSTALNNLQAQNSALIFYRLDVAGLCQEMIDDPATFGLTNVTNAAAPGLEPGTASYNTNQIAANANEYLFWDDLHPTTTVHAIFAQAALSLLTLPGDFNRDGIVDAADYTVWRDSLGSTTNLAADGNGSGAIDAGDYDVWKANFGRTAGSGAGGASGVPEPSTFVLLTIGCIVSLVARRRRRVR